MGEVRSPFGEMEMQDGPKAAAHREELSKLEGLLDQGDTNVFHVSPEAQHGPAEAAKYVEKPMESMPKVETHPEEEMPKAA